MTQRFEYTQGLPFVPVRFSYGTQTLETSALVDSGASVNVLPHDIGIRLGLSWETQTRRIRLTGFYANTLAYGVTISAGVGAFPPVTLVAAWAQTNDIPIIFGQMNFFQEFQVGFYGKSQIFLLLTPENI